MKFSGIIAGCFLSCALASVALGASTAEIGTDLGHIRPPKATKGGMVCAGDSKVMGNGDKDSAVNIVAGAACSTTSIQLLTAQEAAVINADRSSDL